MEAASRLVKLSKAFLDYNLLENSVPELKNQKCNI